MAHSASQSVKQQRASEPVNNNDYSCLMYTHRRPLCPSSSPVSTFAPCVSHHMWPWWRLNYPIKLLAQEHQPASWGHQEEWSSTKDKHKREGGRRRRSKSNGNVLNL